MSGKNIFKTKTANPAAFDVVPLDILVGINFLFDFFFYAKKNENIVVLFFHHVSKDAKTAPQGLTKLHLCLIFAKWWFGNITDLQYPTWDVSREEQRSWDASACGVDGLLNWGKGY